MTFMENLVEAFRLFALAGLPLLSFFLLVLKEPIAWVILVVWLIFMYLERDQFQYAGYD